MTGTPHGGHFHGLYRPGNSPVHDLPPQCKVAALLAFVFAVVATPRDAYAAFAAYALLLAGVAALARIPAPFVFRRMLVELPFVFFALLLPFIAHGPRIDVLGLSLSESGLLSMWNILAKGTLGVIASILLAATTDQRDVLHGLRHLRMPSLLVEIMSFMFRYASVVGDDMRRMRVARESRGFVAHNVHQLPVVAHSAAALFIRSYERGERVHLAMLSRGYTGVMPFLADTRAGAAEWTRAAVLPVAALLISLSAWLSR
jgi:cobalt/nickel transport system permease protein